MVENGYYRRDKMGEEETKNKMGRMREVWVYILRGLKVRSERCL